jgi:ParB-like chromosome segregation protein Spo0J
MEIKLMPTKIVKIDIIKINPSNPRVIKDYKYKKLLKSIREFPEMLMLRPIVVSNDMVILGGNQRYRACQEVG